MHAHAQWELAVRMPLRTQEDTNAKIPVLHGAVKSYTKAMVLAGEAGDVGGKEVVADKMRPVVALLQATKDLTVESLLAYLVH